MGCGEQGFLEPLLSSPEGRETSEINLKINIYFLIMDRVIKKFNSFEEQELWQLEYVAKLTPLELLKRFRAIQKVAKKMKPTSDNNDRKIIKRNGFI